jgi:pilus assembly protein CpaF
MGLPVTPSNVVFAVIINEKGGAQRRHIFDKPEVTIGRLQGNDVMLPKGNVSKQHARLRLEGDGFFVSDLNSTNGTYVNRKRIGEALASWRSHLCWRLRPASGAG